MTPLICPACGGPLPRPGASPHLTCAFCGTSTSLDPNAPVVADGAQASAVDFRARFEPECRAFEQALAGNDAIDKAAFVTGAASLDRVCNPEVLANVTLGLADEFRARSGVDLRRHPNALPRLAIAYLGALDDLRAHGQQALRVPMIAVAETGPIDYEGTLTIARLRTLAATEPTPAKRGLLARLFGR